MDHLVGNLSHGAGISEGSRDGWVECGDETAARRFVALAWLNPTSKAPGEVVREVTAKPRYNSSSTERLPCSNWRVLCDVELRPEARSHLHDIRFRRRASDICANQQPFHFPFPYPSSKIHTALG